MHNRVLKVFKAEELNTRLKSMVESIETWQYMYEFDMHMLDPEILSDTPLEKFLEFSTKPVIIKLPPNCWYAFHTDAHRSCALNMLISGGVSHTVFSDCISAQRQTAVELVYSTDTIFLINTQMPHAILNLDKPRYMLSVGFRPPNTFNSIKDFCLSQQF